MAKTEAAPVPRLQERYEREIVPELTQQLGRTNRFVYRRAVGSGRERGVRPGAQRSGPFDATS